MTLTLQCAQCDKTFHSYPSLKRKYCSLHCSGLKTGFKKGGRGNGVIGERGSKNCLFCNKEFVSLLCSQRKFCSRRCSDNSKKDIPTWNKGLTKETDSRIMKYTLAVSPERRREIAIAYGFKKGHAFFSHDFGCGCFKCAPINEYNHSSFRKGLKEETKRKIGAANSISLIGVRCSPRTEFTAARVRGAANHNWKGGITPINQRIRHEPKYIKWRMAVFERDDFTCQICGEKGGILNADHIKQFAFYPELRFDINNGRTLCVSCHRKTDTYGYKGTRKRIDDWLRGQKIPELIESTGEIIE